ncbi:NUDIX domain-containing protein [Streptomyces sp. ACA25]|uniref:NUDIX domain-containing protein n=1 Tax=Streptomyces sp. ACA25 TaxID=3022596 RepID=UPI00230727A8|nr:NUDIX domain-containing protein [Streptomyces sp. ACA25]MDB1086805.1 NUDIX domain-containing protein [Streptomyces sp. ACA25]
MTGSSAVPLATGPLGMKLLAFERVPEETRFTDFELTYVLVALWYGDLLLLVRVRGRDCWELPGGGIDAGETPREAAVRELLEESGQVVAPEALRFAGFARTALPNRRIRYGGLFTARVTGRTEFAPSDEISAISWWDQRAELPGGQLQTVDSYLARLTRD